ncbi:MULTISPECIES: ABC-three component system protein [Aeromonas]|uniref:ABC-three component system protein n=1 Tax=Aeromonas TaxID=642 RepID=UPI00290D2FE5|nr:MULTISPECIES: ABC-three component system protein [Aeromonas]MDU7581729.1 ABC-three component system protein [Aeromonas sp.]
MGVVVAGETKQSVGATFSELSAPTPWPGANARLLGLGVGLPIAPLVRLAQFSAAEFERFTLEWASDYLAKQQHVNEVQQRGGAGDKGRDIVVWLDPANVSPRRWFLYQCKHYDANLGLSKAGVEIAKVIFYTFVEDYTVPEAYYFVTHKGVTSPFQDLLDDPDKLKHAILSGWTTYAKAVTSKHDIPLTTKLRDYIDKFDFSIFRAKQPHDLLEEHSKTSFHLTVFGAPLIERIPPEAPPSAVDPIETVYVEQLYAVISHDIARPVQTLADFETSLSHVNLFERSRITFYCAEGLKELARDQMANQAYFNTLLGEFDDGLYYTYTDHEGMPLVRLKSTVKAAQTLQLGSHPLAAHVTSKDREGMCHQLANEKVIDWCNP